MALTFLKLLDSLSACIRTFTPAKVRELRRLTRAISVLILALIAFVVTLAFVFLHVVSELKRMGYTLTFLT